MINVALMSGCLFSCLRDGADLLFLLFLWGLFCLQAALTDVHEEQKTERVIIILNYKTLSITTDYWALAHYFDFATFIGAV